MKKWWLLLMICAMLSGCGAEETFETVADEILEVAAVVPGMGNTPKSLPVTVRSWSRSPKRALPKSMRIGWRTICINTRSSPTVTDLQLSCILKDWMHPAQLTQ